MDEKNMITLKFSVDRTEVDVTLEKVEKLHALLRETNSLLEELASKGLLKIDVQV